LLIFRCKKQRKQSGAAGGDLFAKRLETSAGLRHDYAAGESAFAGAGMKYAGI
jgi:hypothetical protein